MSAHGFEGFLLMNADGEYLQWRNCGVHVDVRFTSDVDEADVFTEQRLEALSTNYYCANLEKLPARVVNVRTVVLL